MVPARRKSQSTRGKTGAGDTGWGDATTMAELAIAVCGHYQELAGHGTYSANCPECNAPMPKLTERE